MAFLNVNLSIFVHDILVAFVATWFPGTNLYIYMCVYPYHIVTIAITFSHCKLLKIEQFNLLNFVQNMVCKPSTGVAGGSASGKTTVCDMIIEQLHDQRVVLVSQVNHHAKFFDILSCLYGY